MEIADLASFDANSSFEADLAIIGGGPAGLTIARELFGTSIRVIVLESGLLEEASTYAELAELESLGEPRTQAQREKRVIFHGASSSSWSQQLQPYGVRCRALGGSTHAWAGKSAAFDAIDFSTRAWVPYSGWPIELETLGPFMDRAGRILNLGPNCYDDSLWELMGSRPPEPQLDKDRLRSFFWQFSRSRLDQFDIMRPGREFVTFDAKNTRVLLNATVTQIALDPEGSNIDHLEVSTIEGVRSTVKVKRAVIACGGIENARLLLISNAVQKCGLGNAHDVVGRFLMDHVGSRVGHFESDGIAKIAKRFGFYGVPDGGRSHMYMHGLAPTPQLQERMKLYNSAVYFMPENSPDDPWDALKRLIRRNSENPFQDLKSLLSGAGLLSRGVGMKVLTSSATPDVVKNFVVNTAIRYNPNLVADEFQSRGVPHKIKSVSIDAIGEQRPDPDSRVTLSARTDRLGMRLAKVDWRIHDEERRTIIEVAMLTRDVFANVGLPLPRLEPWVAEGRPEDGVIIDMAHTLGTTRMSNDAKFGVVDEDCQVHGVRGLYVAGGSVFPTSGHANPTLMIVTLAVRLADHLKSEFAKH